MNTKIVISAIALLLLFSSNTSFGASQKHLIKFASGFNQNNPVEHNSQRDRPLGNNSDWAFDVAKENNETGHEHETHHFHYNRFHKHRNRILFIIGLKLLLLIAHLSTFLVTTIHCLH